MALQIPAQQQRVRVSSTSPAPRCWEDVAKRHAGVATTTTTTTAMRATASSSSSTAASAASSTTARASGHTNRNTNMNLKVRTGGSASTRTASASTMTPSNSSTSISSASGRQLTPASARAPAAAAPGGMAAGHHPQLGPYRPTGHLSSRHPQHLQRQLAPARRAGQQLQLPQHQHVKQPQPQHQQAATPTPKTDGSSFGTATTAEPRSVEASVESSPASSVRTEQQDGDDNNENDSEEGSTGTTSSSFSIHNMAVEVSAAFWRSLSFWESKSQQQEQRKQEEQQQKQAKKHQQQCEEAAAPCEQGLKRQPFQHFQPTQPRQGLRLLQARQPAQEKKAERMRVGVVAPGAGTTANAAVYARLGSQPGVELSIQGKPRATYDRYPSSWPGGSSGPNLESFASELAQNGFVTRQDALVFGSRGGQVVLPSLWRKYGGKAPPAVVINGGCAMGLPTTVEWPETAVTFLLMGGQDNFRGRMGREEYLADAQARVPKANASTAILFVNEMAHMPQGALLGDVLQPMLKTIMAWKSGSVPEEQLKAVLEAVSSTGKWSGKLLYTTSPGNWEERTFGPRAAARGGA